MKKASNLLLQFQKEVEQLSREQLKNVLGGVSVFTTSVNKCNCNKTEDCKNGETCRNCGSNGENGRKWGYCTNDQ